MAGGRVSLRTSIRRNSAEKKSDLDVDFNSTSCDNSSIEVEMNFGERLRQLRKDRGLTLRGLAEKIKVDFSYLSKIENNRLPHTPSADTVRAIASALQTNPIELLRMADKLPPELDSMNAVPAARRFMERATQVASPDDWEALLNLLEKRHSKLRARKEEGGAE
jgi:transcriptional regulator with XRE-family HTH domain